MSAAMTDLERDFAEACTRATGHEARRVGDEWKTLCPVHGDRTPSLDFHEENGIIVATCRSRDCAWEAIRTAIDWKPKATRGDTFAGRPVRARFTYTDADGREIAQKIRFDDDREPKCMFSKKLNGEKLPLYRLPGVLADVRDGRTVYVAEGEKDADTLTGLGFCGTSAPYGAVTGEHVSGKWLPTYTAALAGADVVLLQDADAAGVENVRNVARLLAGRVKSLRIVPPFPGPKGADVSDFFAANGREAALAFIETAEAPSEIVSPRATSGATADPDGGSWITLSDVAPERVTWLQLHRLARGKLTLWDGDPGLGKGFALMSLLAAVSTGSELPGRGNFGPADVILLSSEDGLADTIRPRIDAAGGDPARIHVLSFVRYEGRKFFPSLRRDLDIIEEKAAKHGAAVLAIDPFMGFLGAKDSHKDADVKEALGPFAQTIDRLKLAAIGIRHLNKAQIASSLYRGGGSIGIIGAARSAFLVAADPEDPERRIIAATKANLCPMPPSLAFTIKGTPNGSARAVFEPHTNELRADALLQSVIDGQGSKCVGSEAADWLATALKDGPRETCELKDEAVNGQGFSWVTVKRASQRLGVSKRKEHGAKHGGWIWSLDGQEDQSRTQKNESLDSLGVTKGSRESRGSKSSNKRFSQEDQGTQNKVTGTLIPLTAGNPVEKAEASIQARPAVKNGTEDDLLAAGRREFDAHARDTASWLGLGKV